MLNGSESILRAGMAKHTAKINAACSAARAARELLKYGNAPETSQKDVQAENCDLTCKDTKKW